MKVYCLKKRYITLIEIMIVMFLIALITGVLAYNFQGSLEEGKKFKTQTAMEKLETILNLEVARNPSLIQDIDSGWQAIVDKSPLVHNAKDLKFDGWGHEYRVTKDENDRIHIESQGLTEYLRRKENK